MKITSAANPKIKQIIRLKDRGHRQKDGLTVIEGVREVTRALEAGVKLMEVYVCPEYLDRPTDLSADIAKFRTLADKMTRPVEVTPAVFRKIAFGERKEGVVGVGSLTPRPLSGLKISAGSLVVVADGIEKPGNLGAILRTCDAAGVDALIVCSGTDLDNPNVIRASIGTAFTVPAACAEVTEAAAFLKDRKIRVITSVVDAAQTYNQADLSSGCAIVLGREQSGVSEEWSRAGAQAVRIPMRGKSDSLNVSAAAAVLIFEALRQRDK